MPSEAIQLVVAVFLGGLLVAPKFTMNFVVRHASHYMSLGFLEIRRLAEQLLEMRLNGKHILAFPGILYAHLGYCTYPIHFY